MSNHCCQYCRAMSSGMRDGYIQAYIAHFMACIRGGFGTDNLLYKTNDVTTWSCRSTALQSRRHTFLVMLRLCRGCMPGIHNKTHLGAKAFIRPVDKYNAVH